MENNLVYKFNEFGNYLLSVNNDENKKIYIYGSVIDHPSKEFLLKILRPEDENENKIIIDKDVNGNDQQVQKYSQVNEWINIFGLKNDKETKQKLNEYLNELLKLKN